MKQAIRDILDRLPAQPGVYIMKGERGEVLYIGKATSLRSRVRSYFSGNDTRAFVAHLDTLLFDIETIVTTSPKEALLLENTLIKRHSPRFNFKLRDDKNYLSIRIRREDTWPRVELVRSIRNDNATYFGPYHSASKVRQTLNVLNRHFHLRTCRDAVLRNRTRPCLQFQIKRCPAPCVLPVDRAALAEGFCAQCRQQGLIDRVDSDSAEGGFTDEFTSAPGAAIGVDVDGSEARNGSHLPAGLGNPVGINLTAHRTLANRFPQWR